MRGSGGSDGGCFTFLLGLALCLGGAYLFLDSVHVRTGNMGVLAGLGNRHGGLGMTTSMGLIFVPFFLGVIMMFYNSKMKSGWVLTGLGVVIIIVEIVSRIRFNMSMKTTHLLLLFLMMAGGLGLMLKSFRAIEATSEK